MATRDNNYYSSGLGRAKSPSPGDSHASSNFFHAGQGGRTTLPPLPAACPTSQFPVPAYSGSQYPQQRMSTSTATRYDYDGQYNGNPSWHDGGHNSYEYYNGQDARYQHAHSAYPSGVYPQSGGVDPRKLPPLSTAGGHRDERWANYPATNSSNIRSPTASYPNSYNNYTSDHNYGYNMPVTNTLPMNSHGLSEHRASSPSYRPHGSTTPPPVSPVSEESTTIKKKRKRADAAQLKILNEVYARTAFPSTEERQQLAKTLDMSARSVQIWFQNKRQSMRQTRQSSSSHQTFALAGGDGGDDGMSQSGYTTSGSSPYASRPPSESQRRPRSQDPAPDQRQQWPRGY